MGDNTFDPPPTELPPLEPDAPKQIGNYTIVQLLGEGGMGEVYEAEQTEPVRRRVALKLIKWGMDTKQVVARFESERQALALMDHPNIARVLDAGASEQGRLFFVMELARGVPVTEYCDEYRLDTRQRLQLFLQVCDGVQHAHQKGVIHRDIKPSNVLVTLKDSEPVPKLIDFGVAKATSRRLTEQTVYTELGQLIGTPEYMSPEQAGATALDVDTRSDVYSLGLLLYELLVGALPYDPRELRKARFDELCRRIREDEPPRPSTRVGTLGAAAGQAAEKRATDAGSLARQLRSELDWIVMRALEKDRTRRYPSASGLAADIGRYLRNEPVQACPPSTLYRLSKFVRRHRVGVLAGGLVAVTLVVGILGSSIGLVRALRAERRATREAETARQVSEFLVGIFEESDPRLASGREITARELLDQGAKKISIELEEQPLVQARLMDLIGRVYRALGNYDDARPLLEQSLRIRERDLGAGHLEVAETLHNLANLCADKGEFESAEALYDRALEIREGELGGDHPDVAQTLNHLARLHHDRGDLDAAQPLYERALEIRRRGPQDAALAESLNDLGTLHHGRGDFDKARPLYERSLEIATLVQGTDSLDAADTLHNLATLLYQTGDFAGAKRLYERELKISESALGPDHPDVGDSVNNLAMLYHETGDLEAARPLYERALRMTEKVLGPEHPDTATSLNNLANLLRDTGDHDAAQQLYRRALRIRERVFGPGHRLVATTLENLAVLLLKTGDPNTAGLHLRRAVRILETKLGPEHAALAPVLDSYAKALDATGRGSEARAARERAAAIRAD